MKLSELVDYLNHIDAFELHQMHHQARRSLDIVIHRIEHSDLQFGKFTQRIKSDGQAIDKSFETFSQTVASIRDHVTDAIAVLHADYLRESLRLFTHEMCHDSNEYILNRKLHCDAESTELLYGRILHFSDWRIPGLIFRPAVEKHIEHLVPLDPLYLVDNNFDLLQPAVQQFTPEYRRRLRQYTVSESVGRPILSALPDNQFGYCFAYNYFNFKPMEIICQYLDELWKKLRPGGVFFFTFNDCDRSHGVALAERHFMCYTPGSMIKDHAESLGFEVSHRHIGLGDIAWLELTKPGDIKSIRGGQTLAKIVANSK